MFKKKTVRAGSIIAIVLSVVGLMLSVLGALISEETFSAFVFFMGIVSWVFLLWASIIAYQLCTFYDLYDEEYKKIGYRVLYIIIAFILFFFVGYIIGFGLAVIILATLWALKANYDEWDNS